MVFTADDKQLIKSLRQLKVTVHESFCKNFHREVGHVEDLTACLQKLIKNIYGTAERVAGRGRPRTPRTADNVATVKKLVQSQEYKPSLTHHSLRFVRQQWRQRTSSNQKGSCLSCLSLFNDSLKRTRNYRVDGSLCHFKYPKVVPFGRHRAKEKLARFFIETRCRCTPCGH